MVDGAAENETQKELREDAAAGEEDPVTSREAKEQDLMAEGESEGGDEIGDQMP